MRTDILKIFSFLFLIFSIVIILNLFKVSSLYPLSDVNCLRMRINNYESQNNIINPQEFAYIKEECSYLRKNLAEYYKRIGFLGFFSATSLFIASILLFFSSKKSKDINLQNIEDKKK